MIRNIENDRAEKLKAYDQEQRRNEADAPAQDCNVVGEPHLQGHVHSTFGLGVDLEQANRWNEAMIHELTAALAQKDCERQNAEFASRHARVELALVARENAKLKREVVAEQASHAATLRKLQQLLNALGNPKQCDPERNTIRPRCE